MKQLKKYEATYSNMSWEEQTLADHTLRDNLLMV